MQLYHIPPDCGFTTPPVLTRVDSNLASGRRNALQHLVDDGNSYVCANVSHMIPVLILCVKMLVLRQIRLVQIVRKRVRQLVGQLLKGRCSVGLGIVSIEFRKSLFYTVITQHRAQGGKIEIVACGIALQRKHRLDPEHLTFGGNRKLRSFRLYNSRFQRLASDELTHSSLDTIKRPKNQNRTPHTRGLPSGDGFKIFQYRIKPFPQIRQYVVMIYGKTVMRVSGGSSSTDKNRARNNPLEMRSR